MIRLTLALLLGSTACSGSADTFFVRREGADLPVWRQGDAEGGTLLVMQHGSGASGRVYDWMPAFDTLEASYPVVYWDQRGAGHSQGRPPEESFTLEDSVEDLDLVLDAVRDRYTPDRVVLMGHSLGGGLSLAYLRDPERAAGIDAYVDLSGGRSLPESYAIVRQAMLSAADARADDAMADFYARHPEFPDDPAERLQHGAYVDEVLLDQGYDQPASTAAMQGFLTRRGIQGTLFGSFDALAYGPNTARFLRSFESSQVDMTPDDVAGIEVPTLVLAGRHDFAVPVEVSRATFEALGGEGSPGRFVVLEDSGHFPMWDEPEAFSEAVLGFLDEVE